jgi:hypothetical protein
LSEVRPHGARKRDWQPIAFLVAVIVARLGFATLVFARPQLALQNDSDRYVPIAKGILSGQAYSWNTERPGELLNTVGYPLYLAGVYLVGGSAPGTVAIAQLLLSGALALALYLGLRVSVGSAAALGAAVILAVDPLSILWSLTILTETVFAAGLGFGALLLIRWSASRHMRTLVLSGVCLALAAMVKPYALLILGIWAAAVALLPSDHDGSPLKESLGKLRLAVIFVLPTLVLAAPWVVRNALLWNCPSLSSVDRVTMRDYVAAKVVGEYEHISLEEAQAQLRDSDPGVCPRSSGKYLDLILSHPQIYARLHLAGTIPVLVGTSFDRWIEFFGVDYILPDLWRPFMDGGPTAVGSVLVRQLMDFPGAVVLMVALIAWQLLLYALALLGVLAYRRLNSMPLRWNVIVIAIAVLILVLTPGQGGHERFRVPAQPLLAILAAYGLAWGVLPWLQTRRSRHTRPSAS